MVYVSLDLETSGLNPENCQILSFGAVIEDTVNIKPLEELPKLHCIVIHDYIKGEPFALNMNKDIIEMIKEFHQSKDFIAMEQKYNCKFTYEDSLAEVFMNFLLMNGFSKAQNGKIEINVCGKNFATFDKLFLEELPKWNDLIRVHQRVIDPSILFTDWKNDKTLPNLSKCLERADFSSFVSHDALDDALQVVKLLRTQYEK